MTSLKLSIAVAAVACAGCDSSARNVPVASSAAATTTTGSSAVATTGVGGSGAGPGSGGGSAGDGGAAVSSSASSGGSGGAPDPVCAPGATEPCYSGVPASRGVGPCHDGVRTCEPDGLSWGACVGEVIPIPEVCNGIDDDCDGKADAPDYDGDGWTACDGDCCEDFNCSFHPELMNPGAYEYPGNGFDDDCDPTTDDLAATPLCDPAPLSPPTTALALVQAMDLCRFTVESPALPDRIWGVISAELLLADGSPGPPADLQTGVLAAYGPYVAPKKGATMAAISTGTARAEGDPGHVYPEGGFDAQTIAAPPPAYVAPYGGTLPPYLQCPPCSGPACTEVYDSVNLKVRIRVPTNAKSFSFAHKLYTAEYPDRPCQPADDRFVALLTSTVSGIPPDKNVAFELLGNPVSVNDAFFGVCFPQSWPLQSNCPYGTLELIGTGMGGTSGEVDDGAGMPWLISDAPVVGGETINLEFVLWDGTDHQVDSLVLLDAFKWGVGPLNQPIP